MSLTAFLMHSFLGQNTPKSYHNMTTNQERLKGSVLTLCFWNYKTPKKCLIHCALSKVSKIFKQEWYLFFDTTKIKPTCFSSSKEWKTLFLPILNLCITKSKIFHAFFAKRNLQQNLTWKDTEKLEWKNRIVCIYYQKFQSYLYFSLPCSCIINCLNGLIMVLAPIILVLNYSF